MPYLVIFRIDLLVYPCLLPRIFKVIFIDIFTLVLVWIGILYLPIIVSLNESYSKLLQSLYLLQLGLPYQGFCLFLVTLNYLAVSDAVKLTICLQSDLQVIKHMILRVIHFD